MSTRPRGSCAERSPLALLEAPAAKSGEGDPVPWLLVSAYLSFDSGPLASCAAAFRCLLHYDVYAFRQDMSVVAECHDCLQDLRVKVTSHAHARDGWVLYYRRSAEDAQAGPAALAYAYHPGLCYLLCEHCHGVLLCPGPRPARARSAPCSHAHHTASLPARPRRVRW